LEKFFHGVNFEKMFVLREFVTFEFTFSLGKDWSLSSSLSSVEFGSKDGNSIEGVLMFLKLLDEELVGFTSGDVKLDHLGGDGSKSVIDPFKMVVGVLDFSFNPFSVSGSIFSNFSVSIGNSGEVSDGLVTVNLLLSPSCIMFFLFFIDRIFKFEEKFFNGVYGVRSHGVGSHHFVDLIVEPVGGCEG